MLTQAHAGTCRHTQSYAPLMHAASACTCTREHYACGRAHSRIRIRICKRMRMHTFSCARTRTRTHMQTHAHAYIFMRTHAHARVCVRHACYHAADTDQFCQSCPVNTSSAAGSGSRLACVFNAGFSATLSNSADGPDSYLSISASSLQTCAAEPSEGAGAGRKKSSYINITNGNARHPSCLLSSVGSSVPFVRARSRVRTA